MQLGRVFYTVPTMHCALEPVCMEGSLYKLHHSDRQLFLGLLLVQQAWLKTQHSGAGSELLPFRVWYFSSKHGYSIDVRTKYLSNSERDSATKAAALDQATVLGSSAQDYFLRLLVDPNNPNLKNPPWLLREHVDAVRNHERALTIHSNCSPLLSYRPILVCNFKWNLYSRLMTMNKNDPRTNQSVHM